MANLKVCDRCGKSISRKEKTLFSMDISYSECSFDWLADIFREEDDLSKDYDLCPECTEELIEFLKPKNKKIQKDI